MSGEEHLLITSNFGNASRLPFVEMKLNGERVTTFLPDKAREVASMLVHAAEAAEQDAFIFGYFKNLDLDDSQCAMVMLEYRHFRDNLAGQR